MSTRLGAYALRFLAVVAGAVIATLAYGRLMLWLGGTCTLACDPKTGLLVGAFAGGLAFALDVGGFRSSLRAEQEEAPLPDD